MRTSPVYYLAPSSISIIPNCNGTASDLAVTIARGTKLKIYYPPIFALGTIDGNYQEWTLAGRNRRLADDTAPYTIYARLSMAEDPTSAASLATAHANGYLIFAKQTKDADGNWTDPYILSPNPSPTSPMNNVMGANGKKYSWPPIPAGQAQNGRTGYWWLKLGVVSAPVNGERTVTLDTGILGTDQYNVDWYLNPDNLPERPVREIQVDRKEWVVLAKDTYTGETGSTAPDGTLDMGVASKLGWTGTEVLSFTQGQEIDEPYHYRSLTRNRWLTQRLDIRNSGYNDKELYERLTSPARGWEEENWVETSRVWHDSSLWECQKEGTTDEPSEDSAGWRLLMRGGADGEDGDSGYSVELTKSSDSAIIDPSGNVVGGYRTVSKDSSQREYYSFRFFTSASVMKGGEYLHLCGALDDDEELGEGNFTIEAIGAGCDLKMEGTTCYITGIWHCNDGNAETPNTSYSENPEEYQLMRAMTECVAHITLNIEGKTAVTKDYRLQLVHLPTDTVVIESHNEVAAVNWSTKKNAWTNPDNIVIPLTASSGGQPVRFQTVNGEDGPDIRTLNKPTWLEGFSLAWADYKDGAGNVLYPASQHMAVEITIPIANIKKNDDIKTSNLLRFNVVTTVDGVEYENIVPFTLNMTTDKAIYVLAPSVRQVVGTMIGGTWDEQAKDVTNARYSYTANGASCNNVSCRLMSYDENNALTEITNASDIHDNVTFLLNGQPSSLAAFRAGLSNTAVAGEDHNLFDELSEIVFAIRLDDNDYESEGVPILRNGAQLSIGSDGYWYIGGVKTEVFAKGTEVVSSKIYYTDPMVDSTPPPYSPEDGQHGLPVNPYLKTECPASVEGKFIHYVSITIFSDSDKTYVYSYGTIGTGNTITVIHDRDYYASSSELTQAQLKDVAESKWSESTPADYSAVKKYLYVRDTARYYKNGAEQAVTVGGIAYPDIVYILLSYWGQDGSGVEFAYYRADDETAANKPSVSVLNKRHPGTAKNPVIADWSGSDGGWYDDNPGFTTQGQVMYQSVNKYSNGQWSGWGDPVIIDRYAQNGLNGDVPMQAFQWNQSATEAPSPLPSGANLGAWRPSAPNSPGDGYFLWMTQTIKHTAQDGTVTYDQWSPAVRISGDTGPAGENGVDGYGLTLTPAQLIFEEKLGSDGQTVSIDYINNTVTAVVQKGKTPLTPTITKVETSGSYSGCDLTKITTSGGTITMTSGSITLASGASAGHFTVNIEADDDKYNQNVRINFYVNRLGTFTRTINGAIEKAKGEMTKYTDNKDSAVRHDYAVAIETSAKGLTQQFTEQISKAGDYNRNLFGFHKGANFSQFATIPFIQGYGLVVTSNNGSRRQGRVSNLGFENVGGYFVVTFMAKTNANFANYPNQQYAKVRVDLCDVEPIHNIGSIGDNINIAVNNNWQSYEYHFFLPEGISYMSPDSYNGFIDFEEANEYGITPIITNQGAYIYIRHLKIERGQTATDFCEADEDVAYLGHGNVAKNLDFRSYRTEDAENQTVDGRSGVYRIRVPYLTNTYPWGDTTNPFRDYLVKSDFFNLEAGKCYTLSFWAKSSVNGFIITQHLYKGNYSIINTVGVDLYVDPSNGTIQESIMSDGQTQIKLSTTWTQYFVHFYVANNVPLASVIPLRVLKSYNNSSARNLAYIYMSDIELHEGYVTPTDYFASFINQNARRISLVQQSGTKLAGIDIHNGTVNLMGDRVIFSNSTGTVSGNVWIDPDDGTIHAVNGDFSGKITATSGTIGGFTIDTNRLYNENWNAGIDITYDSKNVKIGKNAQGVMATEDAIIRAENTKAKSLLTDTYNTALYLNASGARYNYAFYGNGNGVLNGFVQGYKVHVLTLIGTATYLNLNDGQVQAIASVGTDSDKIIYLPTLENCRNTLGISVNDNIANFSCCITIINQSAIQDTIYNRDNVYVRGGSQDYTDEITNLTTRPVVLAQGNPKSLNITNCTTCYVVITYINKRFIANYITTTW